MIYYILLGIAAVLLSFQFAIEKKYQTSEGTDAIPSLKFNILYGLATAVIFFCISGSQLQLSVFSVILGLGQALGCLLYTLIGFRIMKSGNMSLYTLFLMSGGMIVPYLYGVAFLNETLTACRIIGLLMMIAAVVLSGNLKTANGKSPVLLCVAVFLLNGMVSIISKCHSIDTTHQAVSCQQFVMLTGLGRFFFSAAALLFCKPRKKDMAFSLRSMPLYIMAASAVGGISYTLQLTGAAHLPATVTYPLITGGCIIFSALADVVFYKEKLSKTQWFSLLLSFAGTFFFL